MDSLPSFNKVHREKNSVTGQVRWLCEQRFLLLHLIARIYKVEYTTIVPAPGRGKKILELKASPVYTVKTLCGDLNENSRTGSYVDALAFKEWNYLERSRK